MIKGIYIARAGMYPKMTQLEIVANNLANVNTTGFKKDSLFVKQMRELTDEQLKSTGSLPGLEVAQYTNFSEGTLYGTGNPLDLAIQGDGFFVLDTPNGSVYTRNGNFHLTADGIIVNSAGHPLMGDGGYIGIHDIERKDFNTLNIDETGRISIKDEPIGKIKIVSFADLDQLKREGDYFISKTPSLELNMENRQTMIKQGFLEGSNVDAISEMVALIELSRQFEAYQRMIQMQDSTLDRTIEVGRI